MRAAFAFGRFLKEKCSLLSSKSMSTSRSLSSSLLTSLTRLLRRVKASEYSLLSIRNAASLASTRCLRKVCFSARVHCTISLQSVICRSVVPGIFLKKVFLTLVSSLVSWFQNLELCFKLCTFSAHYVHQTGEVIICLGALEPKAS